MDLSANAARALEQVKMGLFMLYGASYFTEDEWVKIDGLIHKGEYVFTSGPPKANFLDDELMSFEDMNDKTNGTYKNLSFETLKREESEQQTSSASSFGIIDGPADTPKEPSVVASSDDGSAKKYELFDFSETTNQPSADASTADDNKKVSDELSDLADVNTNPSLNTSFAVQTPEIGSIKSSQQSNTLELSSSEPRSESASESVIEASIESPMEAIVESTSESAPELDSETLEIPKREPKPLPKEGGLALGYTQAQLEEMKAFNASLTKAGEKGRAKNKRLDPLREDAIAPSSYEPEWEIAVSPTATENDNRIQSWACGVDAQDPTDPTVVSPTPKKVVAASDKSTLVEKFVEVHGRIPKNSNDITQPNNPNFRPLDQRSVSRASNRTSIKSTGKSTPSKGPVVPELNVAPGTILVAQSSYTGSTKIQIDIQAGDKIRVIKHVSGTAHVGENLRTGLKGQFQESVFKRVLGQTAASTLIEQQRIAARRTPRAPSIVSNGLDRVEGINAADWEEESVISRQRAPPPKSKPVGGLANSRFAVLDDENDQEQQVEKLARLEVGKMVDERVAQILAAQTRTAVKTPLKEPLKAVAPKTETCWFWKTPGQTCRFQDHECRDAHYFLATPLGEPTNLRMGKPTWGALADSVSPSSPAMNTPPKGFSNSDKTGLKTCWYWANDTCTNSPQDCKYLHEFSVAGVAPKPARSLSLWKRASASKPWRAESQDDVGEESVWGDETEGAGGEGQGEMVLEEASDDRWGNSEWNGAGESVNDAWGVAEDKYRAPHVRALEQRAAMAINGW